MANLRTNNLSGEQGQNAYRGSVFFSRGTASSQSDSFNFSGIAIGTSDFTIEGWLYKTKTDDYPVIFDTRESGNGDAGGFFFGTDSSNYLYFYTQSTNAIKQTIITNNSWYHFALVRTGGTTTLYLNGQVSGTYSDSNNYSNDITKLATSQQYTGGVQNNWNWGGYLSNIRIVVGSAVYTSAFTPPTSELKAIPNTKLLCCQNSDDPLQEETGRTLTGVGNHATVGYNKTQGKVLPPFGVDAGNTFGGSIQQSTEGYMYFPTGRTEERGRGRAIWGGGQNPSNKVVMDFFQIQTGGKTIDFGNLTDARNEVRACGSSTRGVWAGGRDPGLSNIIDFVEIPTTANAVDFGNLTVARAAVAAVSNSTRGCFMAGFAPSNTNHIDFITIATKGDATDFGDMLGTYQAQGRAMSPTRGLAAGNYGASNLIEFITIATTGNSTDFGDRTVAAYSLSGTSDNTRGIFTGGDGTPSTTNVIDFVTMASTGNATDFGDLITANGSSHADTSDSIIGCIGGGVSNTNAIEKITIQSTGDAVDHGDLTSGRSQLGATSDSHGGL
jgi:hypothetical protein